MEVGGRWERGSEGGSEARERGEGNLEEGKEGRTRGQGWRKGTCAVGREGGRGRDLIISTFNKSTFYTVRVHYKREN